MNARKITSSIASFFLLCAVLAAPARGAIAVVSNLAPEGEEEPLKDSSGTPLPAGTEVKIGTFALNNARQLARDGLQPLLAAFRPFGDPFAIGDGAGGRAGMVEASATGPVEPDSDLAHLEVYLLTGNAATLETSTELLVLSLSTERLPGDIPGGIENYIGLPIRDGHPVHGSGGGDFRTEPIKILPKPFEEWIVEQLPGAAPEDLLPGADPDGDGVSNIQEFALGSHPGNPASVETLRVTMYQGNPHVVFNRRLDEPNLSYSVEQALTPAGRWHGGGDLQQVVEDPSPPPPQGYEQVRQQMHGGDSYFARLVIEYSP